MRTVTAEEAAQNFPELLSLAESGEPVLITREGRPIATLTPFPHVAMTPEERKVAIERVAALMKRGIGPWPDDFQKPTRDEMHERRPRRHTPP